MIMIEIALDYMMKLQLKVMELMKKKNELVEQEDSLKSEAEHLGKEIVVTLLY